MIHSLSGDRPTGIEANPHGRLPRSFVLRAVAVPLGGQLIGFALAAAGAIWHATHGSGLIALFWVAASLCAGYYAARFVLDVLDRRVVDIEGTLSRKISRDSESDQYELLVAGVTVKTSKRLFTSAIDGAVYRVYFLPRSRWTVKLEQLTRA